MKRLEFSGTLRLSESPSEQTTEGLVPVVIDAYSGGPMQPGLWGRVVIDLNGLRWRQQIPLLADHDGRVGSVIGRLDGFDVSTGRLVVSGYVYADTEEGRAVLAAAAKGHQWQASVGVDVLKYQEVKGQTTVNGQTVQGPVTVVQAGELVEVSIVPIGADRTTSVDVLAASERKGGKTMSMHESRELEFQEYLSSLGVPVESLNEDAIRALFELWLKAADKVKCEDDEEDKAEEEGDEEDKAEAADDEADDEEDAEDDEEDDYEEDDDEEDEEMPSDEVNAGYRRYVRQRKSGLPDYRQVSFAGNRLAGHRDTLAVLEAGVMLTGSCAKVAEKVYRPELLEEADRIRGIGFLELADHVLRLEGAQVRGMSRNERLNAAFSTRAMTNLLANVFTKVLLEAYRETPRTSTTIGRVLSAPDFKEGTIARLTGDYRLEAVAADQELPYAKITDMGFKFQIKTYGKIVGITRQDIINDDLNALTAVPQQLGRGAAIALEQAFYGMIETQTGSFFTAGNGNLLSTSPLTLDNLAKAVEAIRVQKDPNGNPFWNRPRYLLVPPGLESYANQLFTSTTVALAGTAGTITKIGADNPFRGLYQPVVTEFLASNGANSTWYLVADPALNPAFGVIFLRGVDSPVVEMLPQIPNYLGVNWRAYMDFAVALLDYRGAVKATA